jgi:UDP-N-acetylmuramate: L-alanyl-gamma-D-glutamyl-meso-diaminopimelate ligase
MEARAQVAASIDELVAQVVSQVKPGDHLVCMSNGGFGGVHLKLLQALTTPNALSAPGAS